MCPPQSSRADGYWARGGWSSGSGGKHRPFLSPMLILIALPSPHHYRAITKPVSVRRRSTQSSKIYSLRSRLKVVWMAASSDGSTNSIFSLSDPPTPLDQSSRIVIKSVALIQSITSLLYAEWEVALPVTRRGLQQREGEFKSAENSLR